MSNLFKKKSVKYQLNISISYIVLKKPGNTVDRDTVVGVAIERGSKLVTSTEKDVVINATKDGVVQLNDTINVEATMYPIGDASNHKFEEKTAKLLVRKHKRSKGGLGGLIGGSATTPQVIGQIVFKLHELIQEDMPIVRKQVLENCPSYPGSSIEYSVDFRTVEDVHNRPLRSMTYHTPEDDLTPPPLPPPSVKEDFPARSESSNSLNLSTSSTKTAGVAPSDANSNNKNISKSKIIPYTSPKKPTTKTVSTSKDSTDDDIIEEHDPFKYSPSPFSDATGREVKDASFDLSKDSHSPLQGESLMQSSSIIEEDDVFSAAVDFGKLADFDPFGDAALHDTQVSEGRARDDSIFTDWTKESNSPVNPSSPVPIPLVTVPQVPQVKSPTTPATTTHAFPKTTQRTPPPKPDFLSPAKSATKPTDKKQTPTAVAPVASPAAVSKPAEPVNQSAEPNINDINFVKGVIVQQEEKLAQANQFIQYQATTITQLQQRVTQLEEQTRSQEEQLAKAKDYILHQQKMMNSCEEEMLVLRQNMIEAEKNIEQIIMSVITSNEEASEDNQLKEMMVKQSREEIEQAEENILGLIQQVKQLYQQLQKKELQLIQKQQQLNDESRSNYTTPSKAKNLNGGSTGKGSPLPASPTLKNNNKGSVSNRQNSNEKDKSRSKKDVLSPPPTTPLATDFDLSEEVEELRNHYEAKIVELEQTIHDQENQLQQAKEYIAFQETLNANNLNDSEFSDDINLKEYENKIQELSLTVHFQQDQLAKAKEQLAAQETLLSKRNGNGVASPISPNNSNEELKKKYESEKEEMKGKILDLIKSIESLEIQELENQKIPLSPLTQKQSQNTGIDKIKKEYDEKIAELQKKVVDQEEKMAQAQEYISYQESIIASQDSSAYEEKIADLEEKLNSLKQQLEDSEATVQSNEKKVQDLTDLVKQQEQREQLLEGEKQELLDSQDDKNQEIRDLQKKLSELTEQLTKQTNKIPDQFDKVKEFQRIKATYEQKMEELNKTIKSQAEQLQKANETIASNKEEADVLLKEEKEKVARLEEEIGELSNRLDKVSKETEDMTALVGSWDLRNTESEPGIPLSPPSKTVSTQESSEEFKKLQSQLAQVQQEKHELEEMIEQINFAIKSQEDQINQAKEYIAYQESTLTTNQEESVRALKEEQEKVNKLEEEILDLKNKVNESSNMIADVNRKLEETMKEKADLIQKVQKLEKSAAAALSAKSESTPVKSAKDEVQRLQSLNERLGEQLDAVETEKDELQGCLNQIQSHVVMLGKEIQDLHGTLLPEKKAGESSTLGSTGSISYEELSKYLTSLVVTWRELKVTVVTEREKTSSKSLANVAKETAEKLRIAQETLRKQSKEIDEFETEKQDLEDKIAELTSTLQTYEDEINKAKEYIAYQESQLESTHTGSEAALTEERQKVSKLEKEIGELTTQLDAARTTLQSTQSNAQELEKTLAVNETSQGELKNAYSQLQNYTLMIGKEIQDLYSTYLPDRQSAVSRTALPQGANSINQEVLTKYFTALMGSWNELKATVVTEHSKVSSKAEQEAASSKEAAEKLRKALAFVEDLKDQITELEAEKKEHEEQIAELKSLEDQMNQAKEYIAYQESMITSTQEESEAALKEEREKVNKLEEEISEITDHLTEVQRENAGLKEGLQQQSKLNSKAETLEEKLTASQAAQQELESSYNQLQSYTLMIGKEIQDLYTTYLPDRQSPVSRFVSVSVPMKQDVLQQYFTALIGSWKELKASITTEHNKMSTKAQQEVSTSKEITERLKQTLLQLNEARKEKEECAEQIIELNSTIKSLEDQMTQAKEYLAYQESVIESNQEESETALREERDKVNKLEEEIAEMTKQLDDARTGHQSSHSTTQVLEKKLMASESAQEALKNSHSQLQNCTLMIGKEIQDLYSTYLPDRQSAVSKTALPQGANSINQEVLTKYFTALMGSWNELKATVVTEHSKVSSKAEQEAASSKEAAEKLRKALAFVEDLKDQITELEAEKKEHEEQIAELKSLEDQMNQAKEYIAYQESMITSAQEESEAALKEEREKVNKLEEEISDLTYQVDNLSKTIKNLEKEKIQLIQQNEAAAKRRDSNSPAKVSPKEDEFYRLQSLNERLAEHLEEVQGEHDEMRNSLHQVQISVLLIGREIQDLYAHYLPDRKSAISKLPASITTTPLSNTSSDATLADEVFSQYLKALTSSWSELKTSIISSHPAEKAANKSMTSPNIKNNQELETKLRQAEEKIQYQSLQIESLEQEKSDFTRQLTQQSDQLK
eukprot:gene10900-11880_t